MKRLVITFLIIALAIAMVFRYQERIAGKHLQEFATKAYNSVAADYLEVYVGIANDWEGNIPEGLQALVLEVTVRNKSLRVTPRVIASLRFSEDVQKYLDLKEALVCEFGSLAAYSERRSEHILLMPQFNGDSQAIAEVSNLLAHPLMIQVLVGDKPDYLLVTPTVSLFQASQPTPLVDILVAVDEEARLVFSHSGECVVLLEGVKHGEIPYLNTTKDKVAVVIDTEEGETVLVYNLLAQTTHSIYQSSGVRVMGWIGDKILVGSGVSHGIEATAISLSGHKETLPLGVLPLPLSHPVWDFEGRFAAYSASGNTVVVIDINRYQSYTLTYASDPEWTPHGLQVVHDSIARVVQFRH